MDFNISGIAKEFSDKKAVQIKKVKKLVWSGIRLLLLSGLSYVILYPIIYMIVAAVREKQDLFDSAVKWIPKHFTLENLNRVWVAMKYPQSLLFTVALCGICAILCAVSCSLAAYGFARFKFKGQGVFFAIVLLMIIIPATFYRMPSYLLFNKMHLLNNPLSMILPALLGSGIHSGVYIYLFRQFFKGMPKELEEAAYIDGCKYIKTFTRIMLPSAIPVYVTVLLFSFVWYWNDFQLNVLFIQDFHGIQTLSASLSNITNLTVAAFPDVPSGLLDGVQNSIDQMSASVLVIGPLIILYVVLQRYFVESIQRSGLAGD